MRGTPGHALALLAAFLILTGSLSFVGHGTAASPPAGYHLVKKITLGGEGGWDYFTVDSATHRVFIPRGTHTMVLDPDGKVVGDIPKMQGAHGIDFAPDLKRGFTSNGAAHSATIFDPATLQIISDVKIPDRNPDGILYDPATKRVFTFNGAGGNDATAIDAKTGEVLGSVPLGGKPETAQADGKGRIYVNVEDKNQIVEFDSKTLKVLNTWPIAPCNEPAGLAIDIAHKRLFAGCHNQLIAVVDYTTGKVVATVPIGTGVDANRYDPGTGLVFASCGDGTITVAHEDSPDKYTVVQTITTQRGARTMALDTKNHNVYTVTAELGPPASGPTPEIPRPRPTIVPNTFMFLSFSQ
jgi:DNA-binding beta-propeller fold protein YncE